MRGVSSILSRLRNELNEFNKTRARVLDSILSFDIKVTLKSHLCRKNRYNFAIMYVTLLWTS